MMQYEELPSRTLRKKMGIVLIYSSLFLVKTRAPGGAQRSPDIHAHSEHTDIE